VLSLAASVAQPAEPGASKRTGKTALPEPPTVAMVGNEPMYAAEVDDILAGIRRSKTTDPQRLNQLRPVAVEQAINRRLVALYLAGHGYAIDEHEVKDLFAELKRKLQMQNIGFEEFLSQHGFNEQMVRRKLVWDAMWASYLGNEASDKALEDLFERHRSDYDGRELRVSHILWPVKAADDAKRLAEATEDAERVRSEIASGKMSFGQAAGKYSAGPSRRNGGDLGFIPLHDRMTEAFSRAAFDLKKGEISNPVVDQFGVHLIECTDIKPGNKMWQDVRRELLDTFAREKFIELADAQRKKTVVKLIDERK
jgi:parvulin-like peptidyl-prolyl isomerase